MRGETIFRMTALACIVGITCGCHRENRYFEAPPGTDRPPATNKMSPLVGGQDAAALRQERMREYEGNAFHISEGKRLYTWFNCSGCHAHGGGAIGPPLMDDQWIYGGEIDQIYLTIAQGRPNGMPAFQGKIPTQQIWELAAYVRTMGGHGPKSARPSRDDHIQIPAENSRRDEPIHSAPADHEGTG